MVRVYVDTAVPNSRKMRKYGKKHVCYDPQTRTFFKLNNLSDLHGYSEVYVDMLPSNIYEEVLELIKRDIKVFQLTDPQLIKRLREKNRFEKSDENDALILSLIPNKFYKELDANSIKLRQLIKCYLMLDKEIRRLKTKIKSGCEDVKKCFEQSIKIYTRKKNEIKKEIHKLMKNDEFYNRSLEYLGYQRGPLIAMLLTMVDFSKGVHKILDYLGLHAKAERYNRTARAILSKIATYIYIMTLNPRGSSAPMKYIEIAQRYPMRKALLKIQTEIIKDLRRIWLSQQGVPADR